MKKADNPVVIVKGDNNDVEVKVNVTNTSSNTPAAIAIAHAISGNNGRSPEREQRAASNWAYRNVRRGR